MRGLRPLRAAHALVIRHARPATPSAQRMLNTKCFIDSAELTDLNSIFDKGVHDFEVLVLFKGILSRPWCVLEIYEAVKCKILIVTLVSMGQGFDYDEAINFVRNFAPRSTPRRCC